MICKEKLEKTFMKAKAVGLMKNNIKLSLSFTEFSLKDP